MKKLIGILIFIRFFLFILFGALLFRDLRRSIFINSSGKKEGFAWSILLTNSNFKNKQHIRFLAF